MEANRKDLLGVLNNVKKIMSKSRDLPILNCIVLDGINNKVYTTDLEAIFSADINLYDSDNVFVIDHAQLQKILKSLSTDFITIVSNGNNTISINGKINIGIANLDDFPELLNIKEMEFMGTTVVKRLDLANTARIAIWQDAYTKLENVCINNEHIVSTDGHRMYYGKTATWDITELPQILINGVYAGKLASIIKRQEHITVKVFRERNEAKKVYTLIEINDYQTVMFPPPDARFPDYKVFVDSKGENIYELHLETFKKSMNELSAFFGNKGKPNTAKFEFENDTLTISICESKTSLTTSIKGITKSIVIGINPHYIMDMLNCFEENRLSYIRMQMDDNKPVYFNDMANDDFACIIMPCRL